MKLPVRRQSFPEALRQVYYIYREHHSAVATAVNTPAAVAGTANSTAAVSAVVTLCRVCRLLHSCIVLPC